MTLRLRPAPCCSTILTKRRPPCTCSHPAHYHVDNGGSGTACTIHECDCDEFTCSVCGSTSKSAFFYQNEPRSAPERQQHKRKHQHHHHHHRHHR